LPLERMFHLRREVQHDIALADSARSSRSGIRPAVRRIKYYDI
jgi:hypothetical protein